MGGSNIFIDYLFSNDISMEGKGMSFFIRLGVIDGIFGFI